MARSYAISLATIALGIIALRGAINRDLASSVLTHGLIGMVVFGGIGYVIGAIADYVIRHTVELRFRTRVAEVITHIKQLDTENENPDAR